MTYERRRSAWFRVQSGRMTEELTALDTAGRRVRLADLARERPVVLCFLRHFG